MIYQSMSSQPDLALPSPLKPVDMHVHVVGNGSTGSGCWLRVGRWHRPLAALMLRGIGLQGVSPAGPPRTEVSSSILGDSHSR